MAIIMDSYKNGLDFNMNKSSVVYVLRAGSQIIVKIILRRKVIAPRQSLKLKLNSQFSVKKLKICKTNEIVNILHI